MVPPAGFEPALPCEKGILSPLCLPFHHGGNLANQQLTIELNACAGYGHGIRHGRTERIEVNRSATGQIR